MSSLIATSTLVNIAKHSNKLIRLSQLMGVSESPFIVNSMMFLDQRSDPIDIMLAFESDLGTTAKIVRDIALVMSSMNEHGVAVEIIDGENDFNKLFPEHFDPSTRTLTIFGLNVSPSSKDISSDSWKEMIYKNIFKADPHVKTYEEYRKHLSVLKSLDNTSRPDRSSPVHETLSYAVQMATVERSRKFYELVLGASGVYVNFRMSLNDKNRALLDEKIVGSRAMVDGIVKSSTYMIANEIIQTSPKHKSEIHILDAISKKLEKIIGITALQIDADADTVKVHDMLVDIENMSIDIPDAFILKFGKWGNYAFSGVYFQKQMDGTESLSKQYGYTNSKLKIIAIDIESPTSFAHEVVHFRDQNKSDPFRLAIVDHFAEKIDKSDLAQYVSSGSKFNLSYFTDRDEVLARLGEIGFLLNQHGYKDGETIAAFSERVKNHEQSDVSQSGKMKYQVNLVDSIDNYLGQTDRQKQIYFNLAQWVPEELSIVRDYTHSFFYKNDPNIRAALEKRIAQGELRELEIKHRERRDPVVRKIRVASDQDKVGAILSMLTQDELCDVYKKSVELGFFDDGDFFHEISRNSYRLFDGGGSKPAGVSPELLLKQSNELLKLSETVDGSKRPFDALTLLNLIDKRAESLSYQILVTGKKDDAKFIADVSKDYLQFRSFRHLTFLLANELKRTQDRSTMSDDVLKSIIPKSDTGYSVYDTKRWFPLAKPLLEATNVLSKKISWIGNYPVVPGSDIPDHLKIMHLASNKLHQEGINAPDANSSEFCGEQLKKQSKRHFFLTESDVNAISMIPLSRMFNPDRILTSLVKFYKTLAKSLVSKEAVDALGVSVDQIFNSLHYNIASELTLKRGSVSDPVLLLNDVVDALFKQSVFTKSGSITYRKQMAFEPLKVLSHIMLKGDPENKTKLNSFLESAMRTAEIQSVFEESVTRAINEYESDIKLSSAEKISDFLSINDPAYKLIKPLLVDAVDGVERASPVAIQIAKAIFASEILEHGFAERLNCEAIKTEKGVELSCYTRRGQFYYPSLDKFVSPTLLGILRHLYTSFDEKQDLPNSHYLYGKIADSTETAKHKLSDWIEKMDSFYPELTPLTLEFIRNRAHSKNISYDELTPPMHKLFDKEFNREASAFFEELDEKSRTLILPLAASGRLFDYMPDVISEIRHIVDTDFTPEPGSIPDVKLIDARDDLSFVPEPEVETKQEDPPSPLSALNQSVKPSEDGVLTKRQQMRMF